MTLVLVGIERTTIDIVWISTSEINDTIVQK